MRRLFAATAVIAGLAAGGFAWQNGWLSGALTERHLSVHGRGAWMRHSGPAGQLDRTVVARRSEAKPR